MNIYEFCQNLEINSFDIDTLTKALEIYNVMNIARTIDIYRQKSGGGDVYYF